MTRRVVITGVGAVTPLGIGSDPLIDRWTAGESGIEDGFGRCLDFDPADFLSKKEARRGVTVNAVAPGLIETALAEDVAEGEMAKAIPARRIGSPEEVASCIRFLASEQASYVTGTTLTVDGGLSA